ncbi:hypothetical protein QJQ45_001470 [Haematococcus lacustris]|nr:hypothetical protein QJQ45_001470 [Haematococcus lacustris]
MLMTYGDTLEHGSSINALIVPPPAASSNSHPSAAATAAHALGLPHIGKVLAETCEFVFDPATQIGGGIDPGVTQAVSAASGGQARHASGLNNSHRDTKRRLAPIKPHLQHLAAASSAGTSLVANLKHISVTLATCDALEKDMAEESTERHGCAKQLVVFSGAASIGTGGGWGADTVLRACCKVVCRPRGTDQRRGRVVLVDEHRSIRISSAVNGQQPCEKELARRDTDVASRVPVLLEQIQADMLVLAKVRMDACLETTGLLRIDWSQQRDQPVRGLMWCPVVAPRKPPQAPSSSQEATQPAASEPGPSTLPPAKSSKRTEAEQAAEPTQPTKAEQAAELSKGKAAKAKPAPQPGRWVDRDSNAALNMQRIGEVLVA